MMRRIGGPCNPGARQGASATIEKCSASASSRSPCPSPAWLPAAAEQAATRRATAAPTAAPAEAAGAAAEEAAEEAAGAAAGATPAPTGARPPSIPSATQHHRNGSRDGLYVDAVFTQAAAATTHVTTFMGTVTKNVYAQPLYVENGPGGDEVFVVATEDNHVTTYNATTGAMIWDTGPATIGAPVTTDFPAGSGYKPSGITGTPYIDLGSRTNFFDAMTTPDNSATFHHKVFGLGLDTGAVKSGWPVDVDTAAAGFDSGVQSERGAAAVPRRRALRPLRGLRGRQGQLLRLGHWLPGRQPVDGHVVAHQGPEGRHLGAGRAAHRRHLDLPGDRQHVRANNVWSGGEAVIRLSPGPTFSGNAPDYYAPTNWQALDNSDTDLGGASEILLDMPGAGASPGRRGRQGRQPVRPEPRRPGRHRRRAAQDAGDQRQVKGAPAAYTTAMGTYVALHIESGTAPAAPGQGGTAWSCSHPERDGGHGEDRLVLDATRPRLAHGHDHRRPLQGDRVERRRQAVRMNGDTGAVIVDGSKTGMSTAIQKWNTPIDARGRIVVGVNGQLYVFTP